jgi:hypothetical protein
MKTRILQLPFLFLLLLLPVWFCGNIAVPKTTDNQSVTLKSKFSFWSKKQLKTALKRLKTYTSDEKRERNGRIAAWILASILALVLLYFLQGSLWLLASAVFIGLVLKWRSIFPKKEYPTEYLQYKGEYNEQDENRQKMAHPANKNTRRSLWNFGCAILSFIIGVSILGGAGEGVGIAILLIGGFVFMILSLVYAIIAMTRKEPQRNWTLIPLIILGSAILGGGCGGCLGG